MNDPAMLGSSGYARLSDDAYNTPTWVTKALLDNFRLPLVIWEPASGAGEMVSVLEDRGHRVHASDIKTGQDFLKCDEVSSAAIVTNPPYSHAEEFIRHALALMAARERPVSGKIAMLLRNEFDSGKRRRDFFKNHPAFDLKITLTKRPVWFPSKPGDKKISPRHNFSWFCWDFGRQDGPPAIKWAP